MKKCPYCAELIQDEAIKCRYCGEFLDGRWRAQARVVAGYPRVYWGYEYRSRHGLFGWPWVHIAQGIDPETGRMRVARGIIALGNVAIGVVAVGSLAIGGFAFGGLGLGLLAFGGLALGVIALGGMTAGLYLAAGGMALSLAYAIGGLALAPHSIGPMGVDAEFLQMLGEWWPSIAQFLSGRGS